MKNITFILSLCFTFIFTSCENQMDETNEHESAEVSARVQVKEIFKGEIADMSPELTLYYSNNNWNFTNARDRMDSYMTNFTVTSSGVLSFDFTNSTIIGFISPGIGYNVRTYGAKLKNVNTGATVASISSVSAGRTYSFNIPAAGTYKITFDTEIEMILNDASIKETKRLHMSYRYHVDALFVY